MTRTQDEHETQVETAAKHKPADSAVAREITTPTVAAGGIWLSVERVRGGGGTSARDWAAQSGQ